MGIVRGILLFMLMSCVLIFRAHGQQPSQQVYILASAKIGIYLTLDDFLRNDPLPITRIKYSNGFASIKNLYSLKKSDEIMFHDKYGIRKSKPASEIWGYCTGDNIFVNAGIGFSKLEIIGSISYFIADILVEQIDPQATMSGGSSAFASQPRYSYERQSVILNTATGQMLESSPRNLEKFIEADSSLHDLYSGLKGKEQQKQIIQVISDYNIRHPFVFKQ